MPESHIGLRRTPASAACSKKLMNSVAKALFALFRLHAGAALFRGLVLRDGVLQRTLLLFIAAR